MFGGEEEVQGDDEGMRLSWGDGREEQRVGYSLPVVGFSQGADANARVSRPILGLFRPRLQSSKM